jgi:hypothetical protein
MAVAKTAWGLSGNALKLIALITMTLDHIGAYLLPQYRILRVIGRLSMPIYAFLIAEGCHYTKNKLKYLCLMAFFALGCQVVYYFVLGSLFMCILVTFSLSIILIYALQYVQKKKDFLSCAVFAMALIGVYYISVKLPGKLPGFHIDYGLNGILLPVFFALGSTKPQKLLGGGIGLCVMAMGSTAIQWYGLLALPVLALYSGLRGKGNYKYLFYIYYPLHLAAIYGIRWVLEHGGIL